MSAYRGDCIANKQTNWKEEHWSITSLSETHIHLKWMIANFSFLPYYTSFSIGSPSFNFLSFKWFLRVNPQATIAGKKGDYVALWLCMENPDPISETKAQVRMCLKDVNAVDQSVHSFEHVFDHKAPSLGCYLTSQNELETKRYEFLFKDIFTVFCEIIAVQDVDSAVTEVNEPITINKDGAVSSTFVSKGIERLLNDFEALSREQKNCDVAIKVGLKTYHAHKCILVARSSVFAAMFQHDMKENRSNVVTITDIEAAVMSDVLQYIYCGRVKGNSVDKALDLYVAADKYELKELKAQCADLLGASLKVDNFFEMAALADAYNDGMVIDSLKRFIGNNTSLLSGENWKRFVKQSPNLASEILLGLSQKLSIKN